MLFIAENSSLPASFRFQLLPHPRLTKFNIVWLRWINKFHGHRKTKWRVYSSSNYVVDPNKRVLITSVGIFNSSLLAHYGGCLHYFPGVRPQLNESALWPAPLLVKLFHLNPKIQLSKYLWHQIAGKSFNNPYFSQTCNSSIRCLADSSLFVFLMITHPCKLQCYQRPCTCPFIP